MTEEEQLFAMQALQDKYGYVVLGDPGGSNRQIGEVMNGITLNATGNDFHRDDIRTVIVGFSNIDEWRIQCLDAYGIFDERKAKIFEGKCYRVRAE